MNDSHATINGEHFNTVMEDGVQRFPMNRIVRDLLDKTVQNLNQIAVGEHTGRYTRAERMEFYRLIGYSVCGFSDCFPDADIESSLWVNTVAEDETVRFDEHGFYRW